MNIINKENILKYLYYFLYFIIGFFVAIILYYFEKILFLYPIYFLAFIITLPFKNLFVILISWIILICLNIYFFKIIVLSIIFLSGGLAKNFIAYSFFFEYINHIKMISNQLIAIINNENTNKDSIKKYMNYLIYFEKAMLKIKEKKENSFEVKGKEISNLLTNIVDLYKEIYELNNENEKEEITYNIKNIDDLENIENSFEQEERKKLFNSNKNKIKTLTEYLKDFSKNISYYISKKNYISIFLFNYNAYITLFNTLLLLKGFSNKKISEIFIKENFPIKIIQSSSSSNNKNLVIFCNQNAVNTENYFFTNSNIINYLRGNYIIILWDYYGYGKRKGITSFNEIDKDLKILTEYIEKNFNDFNIIIHGISIGGYSAIKLKKIFSSKNKCILFADRTFSDIKYIIQNMYLGNYLKILYNFLFYFTNSDNVRDYINIKDKKNIFYDENDEIINFINSSLLFGVIQQYFQDIIIQKLINFFKNKDLNENNFLNIFYAHFNIDKNKLNEEINLLYNNRYELFKNISNKNNILFIEDIYKNKNILNFIKYCLIFAYPYNKYRELNESKEIKSFYNNFSFNIKTFIEKIQEKNNQENFILFLNSILSLFEFVNIDEKNKTLNEEIENNLKNYFGNVHRIFCGHNGTLNESDYNIIDKELKKYNFI